MAETQQPQVRTYHARRGRLSTSHRAALGLGDSWLIDPVGDRLDLAALAAGRDVVVDVGCGMGESTIAQALAHPEQLIVAIDVHTRGIATLIREANRRSLPNIRAVLGDAVAFLTERVGEQVLSGARIYFPDPWPKARHRKRRLVQPAFVALLSKRLAHGAFVHCTTDDANYAEQMYEVFAANPNFENQHDRFAPSALGRPSTKYERRANRDGRPVFDILVTRRLSP